MRSRPLTHAFVSAAFPWLAVAVPEKVPYVERRFAVADMGTGWDSTNTASRTLPPTLLYGKGSSHCVIQADLQLIILRQVVPLCLRVHHLWTLAIPVQELSAFEILCDLGQEW